MSQRTFLCRLIFCAVFSVSIVNVFTQASSPTFFLRYSKRAVHQPPEQLICPQSDIADDVLVIVRTGATESRERVPVHLRTTLRCVPHFTVFSDFDEIIDGTEVHDVLGGVSVETKTNDDDFKHYRHLHKHGRQGLREQKVITGMSGSSKGDYTQTDNDGWRLDKWKFLPMIDQALKQKPDSTLR